MTTTYKSPPFGVETRESRAVVVLTDMAVEKLNFVALVVSILVPTAIIFWYYYYLITNKSGGLRRRRLIPGGSDSDSNTSNSSGLPLPPSPAGLPLLGHLHLVAGSLPHRSLRSVAAAHGPVVLLRLGRVATVVVSSARGAEEVMRTRDLAFASRPASPTAARLLYGCRDVAFAPYGEYWRQARRVCVAHLLCARRVRGFRRVRRQEAAHLVHQVRRRCCSCSESDEQQAAVVVELGELLIAYANNVVSRAAFGDESSRGLFGKEEEEDGGGRGRGREVRQVFTEFQELLGTEAVGELLPWLGWVDAVAGRERKIRRTFLALDAVLDKVIDDHRRRRRPTQEDDDDDTRDFVDVLLDVSRNDKEYGVRLATNEIKAIILDMFAGGTDTTTTAMEWAMAELVSHPRAMRKLQDEIRQSQPQPQATEEEEEHLDALPYLSAVIKETLRLHAPIPLLVPRQPAADAEVLGYRVPAGARVLVNAWAIGRDPATWGEDADEFVPERFLGSHVDYGGKSFELLPFGAGRRGCPGIGFAEQSIAAALTSLLYHFDWQPAAAAGLDMTEMNGLAVHIKSGLPLRAKPWIPPPHTSSS